MRDQSSKCNRELHTPVCYAYRLVWLFPVLACTYYSLARRASIIIASISFNHYLLRAPSATLTTVYLSTSQAPTYSLNSPQRPVIRNLAVLQCLYSQSINSISFMLHYYYRQSVRSGSTFPAQVLIRGRAVSYLHHAQHTAANSRTIGN